MSRSKRGGKRSLPPCASHHADDGVDPRELLSRISKSRSHHHVHALCSEVSKLLSLLFAGDVGDQDLIDLEVVRVDPAPDASRLSVVVASHAIDVHDAEASASRAMAQRTKLVALSPYLRSEVARVLQRRRAPDLHFVLVPAATAFFEAGSSAAVEPEEDRDAKAK